MLTEQDVTDIIRTLDAMGVLNGIIAESIHTELDRCSDVLVRHFGDWESIGGIVEGEGEEVDGEVR